MISWCNTKRSTRIHRSQVNHWIVSRNSVPSKRPSNAWNLVNLIAQRAIPNRKSCLFSPFLSPSTLRCGALKLQLWQIQVQFWKIDCAIYVRSAASKTATKWWKDRLFPSCFFCSMFIELFLVHFCECLNYNFHPFEKICALSAGRLNSDVRAEPIYPIFERILFWANDSRLMS